MLLNAVGELPSYLFARQGDDFWMNLYIDAEADFGDAKLALTSAEHGKTLTVETGAPKTIRVRIPEWAKDFALDRPFEREKGYAVVYVSSGRTEIAIYYAAEPVKIEAHPWVGADRGRVAVKRGPVLYCCEKAVENWADLDPVLADSSPVLHHDGTVTVEAENGEVFTLTEYRRWNNRGALPMRIWFRQSGHRADPRDLSGWDGRLYREWTK